MKIYFPGLNGIRAIAALIVIFFHVNSMMFYYGSSSIQYFKSRDEISRHAVVLFFVLSGYLITYLLIKEKEKFGVIDIKKFYLRRILRIWPLFYVAILFALFVVPFNQFEHSISYNLQTIFRYALFIPNFALLAGYIIPTVAPLWSVGVEEQFYAIWPLFLSRLKNIFAFLILFICIYVAIKVILLITGHVHSRFGENFIYFSYDTMAIGGLAAWLYAHNHKILRVLYHPILQIICWLFFIVSFIIGPINVSFIINKEIYSIVFAIIILNVSTNPTPIITLKSRLFDFLGRISYGMYTLHMFIILLTTIPLRYIVPHIPGKPLQLLFVCSAVIPLTILASWVSYYYFESKFLNVKKKYSKVYSTNKEYEKIAKKEMDLNEEVVSL